MDWGKAVRDRWVWAQIGIIVVIGFAAPLLPRYINLGSIDYMLNRLDPVKVRWWGGLLIVAGGGGRGRGAGSRRGQPPPGAPAPARPRRGGGGAGAPPPAPPP